MFYKILQVYEEVSRQKLNCDKTSLFFSNNVNRALLKKSLQSWGPTYKQVWSVEKKNSDPTQTGWLETKYLSQARKEILIKAIFGGLFSLRSHVLSVGGVTFLDLDLYGALCPELDSGPNSPMTSDVFLGLQNEWAQSLRIMIMVE